jgi:hypothetical protein
MTFARLSKRSMLNWVIRISSSNWSLNVREMQKSGRVKTLKTKMEVVAWIKSLKTSKS